MTRKPRIAYLAHSLRSDWNNGNAHFLRGLLGGLHVAGHKVSVYEQEDDWSVTHLREEPLGQASLNQFAAAYPDLSITTYATLDVPYWEQALRGAEIVILHEWTPPALAAMLLTLRDRLQFRLLFHDTHHRALSASEQLRLFQIERFDGVLVFGEILRDIYQRAFHIARTYVLHEAADTALFKPLTGESCRNDVVWIGNWGDEERSSEIKQFLLEPARQLPQHSFTIYGVRYPENGLTALKDAGARYAGYLPNLCAPEVYAASRLTVHIPRQQYAREMTGIPTIRVFEALACGIPLISAPWLDTEHLFREADFTRVRNSDQMRQAMDWLLNDPQAAQAQAARGLETILKHHTCRHRAEQLSTLIEEQFL